MEEKLKEFETAQKKKFEEDLKQKPGSAEIQKILEVLEKESGKNKAISQESLLHRLAENGYNLTFDLDGLPILQNLVKK